MIGDVSSVPFSDGHEGMWTSSTNIITSKIFVFEGFSCNWTRSLISGNSDDWLVLLRYRCSQDLFFRFLTSSFDQEIDILVQNVSGLGNNKPVAVEVSVAMEEIYTLLTCIVDFGWNFWSLNLEYLLYDPSIFTGWGLTCYIWGGYWWSLLWSF